jgi:hypothetical protein
VTIFKDVNHGKMKKSKDHEAKLVEVCEILKSGDCIANQAIKEASVLT